MIFAQIPMYADLEKYGMLTIMMAAFMFYVYQSFDWEKAARKANAEREKADREKAAEREKEDRERMQKQIDVQAAKIDELREEQIEFRDTVIKELAKQNLHIADVLKETNVQMKNHAELINNIYKHASAKFGLQ